MSLLIWGIQSSNIYRNRRENGGYNGAGCEEVLFHGNNDSVQEDEKALKILVTWNVMLKIFLTMQMLLIIKGKVHRRAAARGRGPAVFLLQIHLCWPCLSSDLVDLSEGIKSAPKVKLTFGKYEAVTRIYLKEASGTVGLPGGTIGKEATCQCRRHSEMWVWLLGWKYPLEEDTAMHSTILARGNLMEVETWWATVCGVAKGWTRLKLLSTARSTKVQRVDFEG